MSNEQDPSLGLASLHHIRENLDRMFGVDAWLNWEMETISLELNVVFDDLTRDKIHLLQVLLQHPELFFHDASFFLHAVKVMNNTVADFETLPMPSSLELAYAIIEGHALGLPQNAWKDPDYHIVEIVSYLLRQEGYSEAVVPFNFLPSGLLVAGQTPEDTEDKKRAIAQYIREMSAQ
jgi:hypothetical protein